MRFSRRTKKKMKRNFKKVILQIFAVTALLLLFVFSASAKEYVSGNFKYNVGSKYAVLLEYTGNRTSVKIPSKVKGVPVTAIDEWAFSDKSNMKSVTIPSTVTRIGEAAFNNCTSLKKISLPKNLKKISASAFWYCTGLKQIFIYDKVTSIGKNAFRGCNNATVYVVKGSYAEEHIKELDNVKLAYRYITSLKLDKSSATLQMGDTLGLTYKTAPEKVYSKKVTFKSSNEKVATVSSDGKVTAVACGKAVIICTAKDGSGKVSSCTVKVVPQNVSGLKTTSVTRSSYTLKWNASKGASAYLIKKYDTSAKKWVTVGKTTKTSYSFKDLETGSSTRYSVKAYTTVGNSTYYSPSYKYYTAKTLSPDKVTGLAATAGSTSITLTWKEIDNATGYLVYIYNSEKDEYYLKTDVAAPKAEISALRSNTSYSFAVKAYFKGESGTSYSKYYSEICTATTLPDIVRGFSVISDNTTSDSVTLTWTKNSDCGGYIIYLYNSQTKKYAAYETIKSNDITEFRVTGLKPSTVYYFKIRAFGENESIVGELSSKLKVKTTEKLISADNAPEFFAKALNNTKSSTKSFSIIKQCNILDRTAPDSLEYANVLNSVAHSYSTTYNVVSGKIPNTDLTADSVIAPYNMDCVIEKSLIAEDSVSVEADGNGYVVSFALPSETDKSTVNALLTETIDWQNVAEKNEGFSLTSYTYEGTEFEAKIREEKLDYLTVKVPMKVSFTLDGKPYSFSQTVEYKYFFIWN